MNVYLVYDPAIEPKTWGGNCSDCYEVFVVIAETEETVIETVKKDESFAVANWDERFRCIFKDAIQPSWKIKQIGVALPDQKAGVVCYSWSSTG